MSHICIKRNSCLKPHVSQYLVSIAMILLKWFWTCGYTALICVCTWRITMRLFQQCCCRGPNPSRNAPQCTFGFNLLKCHAIPSRSIGRFFVMQTYSIKIVWILSEWATGSFNSLPLDKMTKYHLSQNGGNCQLEHAEMKKISKVFFHFTLF